MYNDNKYKRRSWAEEDEEDFTPPAPEPMATGFYETTNLCLAAALSLRFDVKGVSKGQISVRYGKPFTPAVFSFERSEALQNAIDEYWNDAMQVNPISFYRQLQTLRSRTHELLNPNN